MYFDKFCVCGFCFEGCSHIIPVWMIIWLLVLTIGMIALSHMTFKVLFQGIWEVGLLCDEGGFTIVLANGYFQQLCFINDLQHMNSLFSQRVFCVPLG